MNVRTDISPQNPMIDFLSQQIAEKSSIYFFLQIGT